MSDLTAPDTTAEIDGKTYSFGLMDPKRQFAISRRLAPVFARVAESGLAGVEPGRAFDIAAALLPMAEAIASLSDDDSDFVVHRCLSVVQRATGNDRGWTPVQAPTGALMFADIDMAVMLRLVVKVLEVNLGPFLQKLPSVASRHAPQAGNS